MAVINIFGTTNIVGNDVRDTINSYGGVADNGFLSYFGEEDINKWSKKKPFAYPADFVDDESIWKAQHYGLAINHMNNWGLVTTQFSSQYKHNLPTGGTTSPFRMGDWRGYTKDAICFFNRFEGTGTMYASEGASYLLWFNSPPSGSILLSDIVVNGVTASNCYPGVVAVKNNTTKYYVITDTKTAGSGYQFGVAIDNLFKEYETWKVYPMLSSTQYATLTENPVNPTCVLCLPNGNPVTTNIRPTSELYQIGINSCTVTEGVGRITTKITVFMKNGSTSARTFNLSYRVEGMRNGVSTELVGWTQIINVSVAGGTSTTQTVSKVAQVETGFDYYIVSIKDNNTGFITSTEA